VKSYNGPPLQIIIDQGSADKFLIQKQLLPENFVQACRDGGVAVVLKNHEGYDHSYFFVSTFLEDHFKHHSQFLKS
jgi:S-formylglutathione hydrolase